MRRHNGPRLRTSSLALLIVLVAGCTTSTPAASVQPVASEGSGLPSDLGAIGCESINLRGPTGSEVELTGIWTAPGAVTWNARQLGDCLVMVAVDDGSTDPGQGTFFEWVCDGKIASDFTITGRCIQIGNFGDLTFGPAAWVILFADDGAIQLQDVTTDCPYGICPEGQVPHEKWDPDQGPWPTPDLLD
jgi:hypothetical protein